MFYCCCRWIISKYLHFSRQETSNSCCCMQVEAKIAFETFLQKFMSFMSRYVLLSWPYEEKKMRVSRFFCSYYSFPWILFIDMTPPLHQRPLIQEFEQQRDGILHNRGDAIQIFLMSQFEDSRRDSEVKVTQKRFRGANCYSIASFIRISTRK